MICVYMCMYVLLKLCRSFLLPGLVHRLSYLFQYVYLPISPGCRACETPVWQTSTNLLSSSQTSSSNASSSNSAKKSSSRQRDDLSIHQIIITNPRMQATRQVAVISDAPYLCMMGHSSISKASSGCQDRTTQLKEIQISFSR